MFDDKILFHHLMIDLFQANEFIIRLKNVLSEKLLMHLHVF